ncbi:MULTISPECIES: hypothetical protein [Rhodococcus]|uniref:Uncharacterized protein n=1 Tax=Rhodococcus cercidiphylli TaxID=489916 RepID=A0ABU4AVJ2_9NOCA|nr:MULTISPECIES: hypothetical protein [Rhodococcus]KAA0927777.1 hypothetical protein FQ188_01415 [Rhodococcus sp. ANT_H53B]MDI9925761.1 hypothetical protein [Rhodococcus sp. IEGM 1341]MDV6230252.1 hypothetical protein [Rhodococcus cercidiphylli]MDV7988736.1 hypothetical protein [Rhodococcus sp. IEGM 1374]
MKQVAAARHRPGRRCDQVQGGAVLVSGVIGSRFDADEAPNVAGEGIGHPRTNARAFAKRAQSRRPLAVYSART